MDFTKIKFFKYSHIDFSQVNIFSRLKCIEFSHIKFNSQYFRLPEIIVKEELNIFRQIKISEPEHSIILANLLNPNGTHGYRDMFLKLFFKVFAPELNIEENEHWFVTAEIERYDIRIRNQNNSKIIIIENKSNNASDQGNQLYRYWFNGIYLAQYNRKLLGLKCFAKILYLSPADYKQPSEQSMSRPNNIDKHFPEKIPMEIMDIAFFNKQIITWLNLCLDSIEENSNAYFYLNQYRAFWR